jgi:ADP-heptose:LPS heptosyltransferase
MLETMWRFGGPARAGRPMLGQLSIHLFVLGKDYHLGDLLWFTAVVAEYRRQMTPERVLVACPDRAISRILAQNPAIDELLYYGRGAQVVADVRARYGATQVVHDLRPVPIAWTMVRSWRTRRPWLYYRDLWLEPRGQWLATFLRLGRLQDIRPMLHLEEDDMVVARTLAAPYIVLAPHTGRYTSRLLGTIWGRVKGWGEARWARLAEALRDEGYTVVTLGAAGEAPVRGTIDLSGLPIRHAAGVIDGAAALVTVESGLWFVAAAVGTPLLIVPWWLPRSLDWVAPMNTPYRLVYRDEASVQHVLAQVRTLMSQDVARRRRVPGAGS